MSEYLLEPVAEMVDLLAAVKAVGIELQGEDWQPYCCGERMQVNAGLIGTDYLKCHQCKTELRNMASPHVNGGCLVGGDWLEEHGMDTWVAYKAKGEEHDD